MSGGISFTGDFQVAALTSLIPGGWYIGFACKACGQHFAILNEPTDSGALAISGSGRFRADCPNCGAANDYAAADVVQFQAAQGGPSSTA